MSTKTRSATTTGLLAGANVLTLDGYQPIETLQPGDRIVTRNGVRKLTALVQTDVAMRPVQVGQGTLGYTRPNSEMCVAPHQEVFIRDWRAEFLFGVPEAIVPISRLVDGKYIKEAQETTLRTVYALQFRSEEIFYADGVEMISAADATSLTTANLSRAA